MMQNYVSEVGFEPTPARVTGSALDHSAILTNWK